jgi:hypothetical protein
MTALIYLFGLFKITKAPIIPGIQPQSVSKNIIKKEPQPLSITESGGKIIANNTLKKLIVQF